MTTAKTRRAARRAKKKVRMVEGRVWVESRGGTRVNEVEGELDSVGWTCLRARESWRCRSERGGTVGGYGEADVEMTVERGCPPTEEQRGCRRCNESR